MSEEIANTNADLMASLGIKVNTNNEALDSVASGDWVPRIQLQSKSDPKSGRTEANRFYLINGSDSINLGKEVLIIPIDWLAQALDTGTLSGENKVSYDFASEDFRDIQKRSETVQNSGCMFGATFLVYLPETNECATVFFGTKSLRNEIPSIKSRLMKPTVLVQHYIETKKYQWWSFKAEDCATPLAVQDPDVIRRAHEKFTALPELAAKRALEAKGGGEKDNTTKEER